MSEQLQASILDRILQSLQALQMQVAHSLSIEQQILTHMARMDETLLAIEELLQTPEATGIRVIPGKPVPRRNPVSVKCLKHSQLPKKLAKLAKRGDPVSDFIFVDNADSTCHVYGTDTAGDLLDISNVATLSVTSSDPSAVTVDPPVGMTFIMHSVFPKPSPLPPDGTVLAHCTVTAVANWNDGSKSFTFDLPIDITVQSSTPTGILIVPGTPVVH